MNHQTIAPAHIAGMNVQFVRRSIADEIERLISILDQMDGDCDLEDSDDDANLAGDRFGDERELDLSDSEPSLGWTHCGAKGRVCSSDLNSGAIAMETTAKVMNLTKSRIMKTRVSIQRLK